MYDFIFKLLFIKKMITTVILVMILNKNLFAEDKINFKEVEATGRAILLSDNIETSRKRALEDALYIAALKGGADVNGFSAISSNTIINDQCLGS